MLGAGPSASRALSPDPAEHVVLLHGVWMRGLTLVPLARRLQAQGFIPHRFDYASLNGPENASSQPTTYEAAPANGLDYQMLKPAELSNVEKIAILILSDTHGATVKEVNPPGR